MNRPMKGLLILVVGLLYGLAGHGQAQGEGTRVTLMLRDGTQVPFTIGVGTSSSNRGAQLVYYYDGVTNTPWGIFMANVGGTSTPIPFTQIARVDLVAPRTETVWRATLHDGRVFDGAVREPDANMRVDGVNQFGAAESLRSMPRIPDDQPFVSVIFDPAAAAPGQNTNPGAQAPVRADVDNVNLRNGDILSGTILTNEFTVQASYGTLTFTKDQLQSITVENAAGRTDQILLRVGDRVSGVLQNVTIEMTLTSGTTITLEKGNIASITFARD